MSRVFLKKQSVVYYRHHVELTVKSINALQNVYKLNLYGSHYITDQGMITLVNIKILTLSCCVQITNETLQLCKHVYKLDISCNNNITDLGLEALISVRKLNISGCSQITDNGMIFYPKFIN